VNTKLRRYMSMRRCMYCGKQFHSYAYSKQQATEEAMGAVWNHQRAKHYPGIHYGQGVQ
jgi:hypothetical protein